MRKARLFIRCHPYLPSSQSSHWQMLKEFLDNKQWDEALAVLKYLLQIYPSRTNIHRKIYEVESKIAARSTQSIIHF